METPQKETNESETFYTPPTHTREVTAGVGLDSGTGLDQNGGAASTLHPNGAPIDELRLDMATVPLQNGSPRRRNLEKVIQNESLYENGYDSDEFCPEYFNIESGIDGLQDYEEEPGKQTPIDGNHVGDAVAQDSLNESINTSTDSSKGADDILENPNHVPIDEEKLKGMVVADLKHQLKLRGGSQAGKKSDLLKRLRTMLDNKVPVDFSRMKKAPKQSKNTNKSKSTKVQTIFPPEAYWETLDPLEAAVEEPVNPTFSKPRAPTVEERDAEVVYVKHNFSETFDRQPWIATSEQLDIGRNGKIKRTSDGKMKTRVVPQKKGCVDPKMIDKYKLTPTSQPTDYMEIFFPKNKNVQKVNGSKNKEFFSIAKATAWTNAKAILANAGSEELYSDFVQFDVNEIQRFLGLYILNGIAPSPDVTYKMRSQITDPVHGKDFVHQAFKGTNMQRRHRHFKAFFSCQDPMIEPPSREIFPNWKVQPLLLWMNYIFPKMWLLGVDVSVDEMTMPFKGKHVNKLRITYNKEGDGFQCDALCQDGYCYCFFFRNEPAPKKYLSQGMSPLHARCMWLFDKLEDKYHHCAMHNLYNSAAFCKRAYQHSMKVMIHGVCRKGQRGLPESVVQTEEKSRVGANNACGTVKAAVLKNDPECPNLIASSVYDTKPVHYLSMVTEKIEWIEKEKPVYNVDSGQMETIKFLRMNYIDTYNSTMGRTDVADQLRGSYRLDTWVRNWKWWWSPLFWGLGTMLTNAYITYLKVNEAYAVPKKNVLSHHDFQKSIAVAWITGKKAAYDSASGDSSNPSDLASAMSPITLESSLSSKKKAKNSRINR